MIMVGCKSVFLLTKIKKFFRENPAAFFGLGFLGLLLVSANLTIQGSSLLADTVAIYAYFSLVIGVFLQFIHLIWYERRQYKKDDG